MTGTGTPDPRSLLAPGNTATAELEKQAKATQDVITAFERLRASQDPLVAAGLQYAESIQAINAAAATGKIGQEALAAAYKGTNDELLRAHAEVNVADVEDFRRLQEQLHPLVELERRHAESLVVIDAAARTGEISTEELADANEKLRESYGTAKEDIQAGKSARRLERRLSVGWAGSAVPGKPRLQPARRSPQGRARRPAPS